MRTLAEAAVLDTSSLARTYPWNAGALVHRNGVPLGVALGSTSPVWVARGTPSSATPTWGVFAMSGAGKTFFVTRSDLRAHRPRVVADCSSDTASSGNGVIRSASNGSGAVTVNT